ncbi:hypothetical protein, conserved [Angomonas deanei]|uniref:Uncharacterized protein n=1 Tax=Angomonas deanei TaxID=59799 RepID=A0A7G2C1T6_9TRYP|nr:hypothetical protein, conserved [Angomonas deanei]
MPLKSEIPNPKVNVSAMYDNSDAASKPQEFDPIPNDPMFYVVENSKYWPPPSLQELHQTTGIVAENDGFDSYDRREDESNAKKERVKIVKGVLNHPRGKPPQNERKTFDSSDDD